MAVYNETEVATVEDHTGAGIPRVAVHKSRFLKSSLYRLIEATSTALAGILKD